MNCTQRYVRKLITDEKLKAREVLAESGNLKYEISVKDLCEDLQRKYYSNLNKDMAFFKGEKLDKTTLEHFSMSERKEMMLWIEILKKWQKEREIFDKKTLGDKDIIGAINLNLKKQGIDMRVTQNTLYRKLNAYRNKVILKSSLIFLKIISK